MSQGNCSNIEKRQSRNVRGQGEVVREYEKMNCEMADFKKESKQKRNRI